MNYIAYWVSKDTQRKLQFECGHSWESEIDSQDYSQKGFRTKQEAFQYIWDKYDGQVYEVLESGNPINDDYVYEEQYVERPKRKPR